MLLTVEQILSNFSGVMALCKLGILHLSARYLKNYLSKGLETWSAGRGS